MSKTDELISKQNCRIICQGWYWFNGVKTCPHSPCVNTGGYECGMNMPDEQITDTDKLIINLNLKIVTLESEIASLKEQIKKEEKTSMELVREAFQSIQNARCSECNELIGTNAAHICQNEFKPKSIFTRRMERSARTYDFVVKHKVLIYQNTRHYGNFTAGKNDCQLQELITLARKEIGYSDKTWSGDIFTSLVNLYRKICV
jgi:hypothetical protein